MDNLYGAYSVVVTEENKKHLLQIQFLLRSSRSVGGEFVLQQQVK